MSSEEGRDLLALSLSNNQPTLSSSTSTSATTPSRSRGNRRSTEEKSKTITPPFPWAKDQRATVHSLKELLQKNIFTITGMVQCKSCETKFELGFDLQEKLIELFQFIQRNKATMLDRAPRVWMSPVLPKCEFCGEENSAKPFFGDTKKKAINWLFLLLGQMLGCCTLNQLKYFCKHNRRHRTGAKDRLLYSTYVELCKQLAPEWFL
ncbi:uncharacterized protein LOC113855549 [Abrus precatorius]|uniref:Uncharacterized protein LOC113855549 n=1 Tax=Abrus precatorius TaxID=3816 RepID=A0A8B8KJD6_ABRPR|nr:uncharacterized protein LOC113855549 [Abrus precatorius]